MIFDKAVRSRLKVVKIAPLHLSFYHPQPMSILYSLTPFLTCRVYLSRHTESYNVMKHQKDPKYLLRCFNSGKKVCEELHTNLCPVLPKVKSLLQRHLRAAGNQPIRWCHFSSFSTFTNGKKIT